MGNRLSMPPAIVQYHLQQQQPAQQSQLASTARRPSASGASWLMGRLEKESATTTKTTTTTTRPRRRRLSTREDSELTLARAHAHSVSEATTLSTSIGETSSSLAFARAFSGDSDDGTVGSSGDFSREPEDEDDEDELDEQEDYKHFASHQAPIKRTIHRTSGSGASVWQQLVGFVSAPRAPCCGGSSPSSSSSTTSMKKRPRCETATAVAEVEEKHRLFWELVQKLLVLNDVVAMMCELQDYLVDHVGASQCAVFLKDPNRNSMSRVMRGHETLSNISQQRGLVGYVLTTKAPLCRQLFAQDLHYDAEVDLRQESVFQRLICVPLLENNNVYAVVQMTTKDATRGAECDQLDMKLLSWLGPILSSCMRKCIEFHDVLLSERTQKALLHIISSSDTEDTVLNLIDGVIAGAGHITKSERLSLFMIDWETKELWTLSSSHHEETIRVPLEASTLGYAASHRMTLNIADTKNDPRYIATIDHKRGINTRCALYVPVGVENGSSFEENSRPMAVLEILNKEGSESFSIDDECAFEAFASEVAVILRRRSNEIEYIKLLADTRAEKVLAQRAKSQVNLLECFTEYVANANANNAADRLRHSFFKNHSRECIVCSDGKHGGTSKCTSIDRVDDMEDLREVAAHQTDSRHVPEVLPPPIAVTVGPPPSPVPMWEFNIFAADPDSLPVMVRDMFLDFRIPEILQCDEVSLRNFIFAVKETYHPNPFHNYLHAVSVVHMTYMILKTTQAANMLQPLDIAACLIAAYCHDVDHPGHTNTFEIVSKSPLALLYSDDSVLERHHACTTFRILSKEKNANILQNLSTSDYRYLRKMIVSAILATDMAQHFKMCESMEKLVNPTPHHKSGTTIGVKRDSAPAVIESCGGAVVDHNSTVTAAAPTSDSSTTLMDAVREAVFSTEAGTTPGSVSKMLSARLAACSAVEDCASSSPYQCNFNGTLEERTFLVKAIVHASDLCGQTFPKPIALKWSNMISREFAFQALLEQADNLPVSFKQLDDPLQMVEGQHFFAHKIVFPLWSLMHQMFPELEICVQNLTDNVNHYDSEIQRLKHHRQWTLATSASHEAAAVAGGDGNSSDSSNSGEAGQWCHSEDEGMAVPGLARCTPAKFNSFRAMKSLSRSVSTSAIGDATFGSVAIEAIELARSRSEFHRARSSSTESSADEEDNARADAEDEIFEIHDVENPKFLSEAA